MANLASGIWQEGSAAVVIVVQNTVAPTQEEWDGYVANIQKLVALPNAVGLALTDGGGPNSRQRSQINAVVGSRKALSAVVTSSMAVRGIVTALRWFNPDVNAFHPDAIRRAMRFLLLDEAQTEALWPTVVTLNRQLSQRSQVVISATAALRGPAARAS